MDYHIGRKIKQALDTRKDLSIKAFSEKVGITDAYAYKLFKQEDVNTELLRKIAEVLEVPVSWFFTEEKLTGYIVQQGNGNKQLINSQLYEQEHAQLLLCQKEVEGLKRENELLREMNSLLKGKA